MWTWTCVCVCVAHVIPKVSGCAIENVNTLMKAHQKKQKQILKGSHWSNLVQFEHQIDNNKNRLQ